MQSVQVVKSSGEDNACFPSPSSDSAPKKESSVESKMIDDKKFFDFVLDCCYAFWKLRLAKEYKENQADVRGFISGIRNYKRELSHMYAEYSSLLEHVNYLLSIGGKN